jgi:hypothetical protein
MAFGVPKNFIAAIFRTKPSRNLESSTKPLLENQNSLETLFFMETFFGFEFE